MTPNAQFGVLVVFPNNTLRLSGHRVMMETSDALEAVIDVSLSLPLKPVDGSFSGWASESCVISKMPSKDAAELACLTGLLTLGSILMCVLSARICGGRLKIVRPPLKDFLVTLVFWLFLWGIAVLVCFIVYAIFGVTYIRPDIDVFSARSGIGIGIAAAMVLHMCILMPYLLCRCTCGCCQAQGRCEQRAIALLPIFAPRKPEELAGNVRLETMA
jgi:hypothetical protein